MGTTAKTQLLAYAAAAVMLGIAAFHVLHGRGSDSTPGRAVAVDGSGAPGSAASVGGEGGGRARPRLYVDVTGAVRRPGLYRVPAGSRVGMAVRRAGGTTRAADPVGVNLAARLQDGEQVVVPVRGAAASAGTAASGSAGPGAGAGAAATASGSAGAGAPGGAPQQPIQLSTATAAQLDGLQGIGPTLAQHIIDYRNRHGGFKSVDELREVDGIGDKRFATLRKGLRP